MNVLYLRHTNTSLYNFYKKKTLTQYAQKGECLKHKIVF